MYFSLLPDVEYLKYDNNPYNGEAFLVKNYFIRAVFSKFIEKFSVLFNNYTIKDSDRPDTLAYNLYGDSFYDWVILLSNPQITSFYKDWPLTQSSLDEYVFQKYRDKAYETKYYLTVEVKDSNGTLILPAGLQVTNDYSVTYNDGGTFITVPSSQCTRRVTNYDYEVELNESKRMIAILQPRFLDGFVEEVEKVLNYDIRTPGVINPKLKTTRTTINKI